MNKILIIALILLVAFAGTTFAAGGYSSQNAVIMGGHMGGNGITPVTKLVKVRYGYTGGDTRTGGDLASGSVVVWDTTSADGYTISGCVADNGQNFAGVLVESVSTADSTAVRGSGANIAYIAVEGYVLATVDSTGATAGNGLALNGATLNRSFVGNSTSRDIGTLLAIPAATDGLAPCWLN